MLAVQEYIKKANFFLLLLFTEKVNSMEKRVEHAEQHKKERIYKQTYKC